MYKATLIIRKNPLPVKVKEVTFPIPPCVGQFVRDHKELLTIKRVIWKEPDMYDNTNTMLLEVEAGD